MARHRWRDALPKERPRRHPRSFEIRVCKECGLLRVRTAARGSWAWYELAAGGDWSRAPGCPPSPKDLAVAAWNQALRASMQHQEDCSLCRPSQLCSEGLRLRMRSREAEAAVIQRASDV